MHVICQGSSSPLLARLQNSVYRDVWEAAGHTAYQSPHIQHAIRCRHEDLLSSETVSGTSLELEALFHLAHPPAALASPFKICLATEFSWGGRGGGGVLRAKGRRYQSLEKGTRVSVISCHFILDFYASTANIARISVPLPQHGPGETSS